MGKVKPPIPVEEVVPHKAPMSFLRHVIKHDEELTVCDVRIDAATMFLDKGRVASWVGLEYMAQAVAAHAGMEARQEGKPAEIGFWLGTRRADFFTNGFRIGQTLHVSARRVWGEGELFSFDCSIADAASKKRLVKAQLNVFRPANVQQLLSATRTMADKR